MKSTIVITMGGLGSRFRDHGYRVPKYRVLARDRSLFDWSLLSLKSFFGEGAQVVFVVQRGDQAGTFIRERADQLGIANTAIVEIEGLTDGQATTALLAGPEITDPAAPLIIFNIDTHIQPDGLSPNDVRGDGWIPCFNAPGDKWSFVRTDDTGKASEVREKRRISENATIGLYHFASFDLYRDVYDRFFADGGGLEASERYIAPMYNLMIEDGLNVYIHDVPADQVVALGTPDDVLSFDPAASPEKYV